MFESFPHPTTKGQLVGSCYNAKYTYYKSWACAAGTACDLTLCPDADPNDYTERDAKKA